MFLLLTNIKNKKVFLCNSQYANVKQSTYKYFRQQIVLVHCLFLFSANEIVLTSKVNTDLFAKEFVANFTLSARSNQYLALITSVSVNMPKNAFRIKHVSNKSFRLDDVPTIVLTKCSCEFVLVLTRLFQTS